MAFTRERAIEIVSEALDRWMDSVLYRGRDRAEVAAEFRGRSQWRPDVIIYWDEYAIRVYDRETRATALVAYDEAVKGRPR
jgi:hypothetical protein